MPSFAPALETTLHKALEAASSRRHEYATLEHLLLALIADEGEYDLEFSVMPADGSAQRITHSIGVLERDATGKVQRFDVANDQHIVCRIRLRRRRRSVLE